MAFFMVSPVDRRDVEQLPAVWGLTIFWTTGRSLGIHRSCANFHIAETFAFPTVLERVISLFQQVQHDGLSR